MMIARLSWFAGLILLAAPAAHAVTMEQADIDQSKAYNKYYNALKNSPDPQGQSAMLRSQTMGPAQAERSAALNSEMKAQLNRPGVSKTTAAEIKKMKGHKNLASKGRGKVPAPAPARATPQKAPLRLDGSNVPREMEFPH